METPTPATPPEGPGQPGLLDVIVNVFATPGEAFAGHRTAPPRTVLWVVPFIISILMVVLYSYVMSSDPTFKAELVEAQAKVMDQQVEKGNITQEQADAQREGMERMGSGLFVVFGSIGGAFITSVFFFLGTLILWLAGKFVLRSSAGYGKYLEVYGMAAWIGILGGIVTLTLWYALGTMYAAPSLSLAILSSFDASDFTHRLLASVNVFTIWQTTVIGIGMGKLSDKPPGLAIGMALGLWVVYAVLASLLNIGR